LEREVHQVTPAKCKLFDRLFQRRDQQLLQEVGTKATGPRSKLVKELGLKIFAAEDEDYGAASLTTEQCLQFRLQLSHAEAEDTTWSLADTVGVTNQL
jgi:hypothetical protein